MRLLILALLLLTAIPANGQVLFQDGFEDGFAPGWYGRFDVFTTTTANAHSGTHSATTNGMWHWLAHDLGAAQSNTTYECWFYDAGTNREEHMIGVSQVDPCCGSQNILWIGLETFFDHTNYMYGRGFDEISSSAVRSTGWRKATFFTNGTTTELYVDDQLIVTETFQAAWRYIVIWENSKFPESHPMNFWDDVKVYTDRPTPTAPTTWGAIKALYH